MIRATFCVQLSLSWTITTVFTDMHTLELRIIPRSFWKMVVLRFHRWVYSIRSVLMAAATVPTEEVLFVKDV